MPPRPQPGADSRHRPPRPPLEGSTLPATRCPWLPAIPRATALRWTRPPCPTSPEEPVTHPDVVVHGREPQGQDLRPGGRVLGVRPLCFPPSLPHPSSRHLQPHADPLLTGDPALNFAPVFLSDALSASSSDPPSPVGASSAWAPGSGCESFCQWTVPSLSSWRPQIGPACDPTYASCPRGQELCLHGASPLRVQPASPFAETHGCIRAHLDGSGQPPSRDPEPHHVRADAVSTKATFAGPWDEDVGLFGGDIAQPTTHMLMDLIHTNIS